MNRFGHLLQPDQGQDARSIHLISKADLSDWLKTLPERARTALEVARFSGKTGELAILPGDKPNEWSAVLGIGERRTLWDLAPAAQKLPEGSYRVVNGTPGAAALGWLLAHYRFDRFLSSSDVVGDRVLLTAEPAAIAENVRLADATALVRDLVNTPAADLGPAELQTLIETIGKEFDAKVGAIRGDDLQTGYPMIHAVGRAAARTASTRRNRCSRCCRSSATHASGIRGETAMRFRISFTAVIGIAISTIMNIATAGAAASGDVNAVLAAQAPFLVISSLVSLVFLLPTIGVTVRRLHDINRSGGWWWIQLIPFVGTIIIIVFAASPSVDQGNRFND